MVTEVKKASTEELKAAAMTLAEFINGDMLAINRIVNSVAAEPSTLVRHWLIDILCTIADIPENERPTR